MNRDLNCKKYTNIALASLHRGDYSRAIDEAREAVRFDASDSFAMLVLGAALGGADRASEAISVLYQAKALAPEDAQVRYNLAVSLQKCGNLESAMYEYRACLDIAPESADALWNYGELLRLREHFEKALECFERLFLIEGRLRPKAAHRMAVCCSYLRLYERAEKFFQDQIGEDDDPLTHWEYAHCLLAQGRFEEAWPHYAYRFEARVRIGVKKNYSTFETWDGQFRARSVLMVRGEQGAGDEILFSAFLPNLLMRATVAQMKVVVVCRPELGRLFQESFPSAIILHDDDLCSSKLVKLIDGAMNVWHTNIGDLPLYVDKPLPAIYLKPKMEDLELANKIIGKKKDGVRRIGLCWSANPSVTQENRIARNVPSSMINEYLKGINGVEFYSLMPFEHNKTLGSVPDVNIKDLSFFVTDFSRTAAAIEIMDEVISVCTSTANLAGALGKKVSVLLQKYSDWRWADEEFWFVNVACYRQSKKSDWGGVLSNIFK